MVSLQTRFFVALGMGLLTVGACETTGDAARSETSARRACFLPQTAVNFRSSDDRTLYIRAQRNEVYQVNVSGFCRDLGAANAVLIQPYGGGSRVCAGDPVTLSVSTLGAGPSRCPARVEGRLTEVELAALPSHDRP